MMQPARTSVAEAIAIVPARGGSKGIPRKNLRRLAGWPLIAFPLACARAAGVGRCLLSTEDGEIAEVAGELGYEVVERPPDLAQDETPTLPVLLHTLEETRAGGAGGDGTELICLLQPTAPLRTPDLIVQCLQRLQDDETLESAFTVLRIPVEHHPDWAYSTNSEGRLELWNGAAAPVGRRQDLAQAFHREGSVYAVRRSVLLEQKSLYGRSSAGVEVCAQASVNLDTQEDWQRASRFLQSDAPLATEVRDLLERFVGPAHLDDRC